MIITGASVFNENFDLVQTDIQIENGIITALGDLADDSAVDFSELYLAPGFIDIHIHGALGADSSSGSTEQLQAISRHLASNGITAFCPTTMTLPHSTLVKTFTTVSDCIGNESGASIIGINMEGPYISYEKKGAQSTEHIRLPDIDEFNSLNAICPIKFVDVAPEIQGATEFAKKVSKACKVSAAHTAADYEQALYAFGNGFSHATHLFNAMTPIKSREPGVPSAVFECENVTAEIICDGFHNHPSVIRTAFKLLGEDRTIVISDSMSAAGLGDGEYELGGQTVYVKGGKATLSDGTIAASTTNIFDEFKNLLRFGIDLKTAIKACTINPAKAAGVDSEIGSIALGKRADLIAFDKDYNLKAVFIKGNRVF